MLKYTIERAVKTPLVFWFSEPKINYEIKNERSKNILLQNTDQDV